MELGAATGGIYDMHRTEMPTGKHATLNLDLRLE